MLQFCVGMFAGTLFGVMIMSLMTVCKKGK